MSIINAIQWNKTELVEHLLDNGGDPDERSDTGMTALMSAVDRGNLDVIQALFGKGADGNIQDQYGNTALMHFVKDKPSWEIYNSVKYDKIFELLLANTDPDIRNDNNENALLRAIDSGAWNEWSYAMTLTHVSDCTIVDSRNHSALYNLIMTYTEEYLGRIDTRPALAQELIDRGDDLNRLDNDGTSLLDLAAAFNVIPIVEVFLANNATLTDVFVKEIVPESKDSHLEELLQKAQDRERVLSQTPGAEETSLYFASFRGDVAAVKSILAKSDTDVNSTTKSGMTSLMVAVSRRHTEVVQELLKHPEIDVNKQDGSGFTSLHYGVMGGNVEIIKQLLSAGADRTIKNKNELTPLRYSRKPEIRAAFAIVVRDFTTITQNVTIKDKFEKSVFSFLPNLIFDSQEKEVMKAVHNGDLCTGLNPGYVERSLRECDASIVLKQLDIVLGICILYMKETLYIDIFCTNTEYKGIGVYMMNLVKGLAKQAGLVNTTLCSVKSAVGFYEKMNFAKNTTIDCDSSLLPMRFVQNGGKRKIKCRSTRRRSTRRRSTRRRSTRRRA